MLSNFEIKFLLDLIGNNWIQHLQIHHCVSHVEEFARGAKSVSRLFRSGVLEPDFPERCWNHDFCILDQNLQVHQLQQDHVTTIRNSDTGLFTKKERVRWND